MGLSQERDGGLGCRLSIFLAACPPVGEGRADVRSSSSSERPVPQDSTPVPHGQPAAPGPPVHLCLVSAPQSPAALS